MLPSGIARLHVVSALFAAIISLRSRQIRSERSSYPPLTSGNVPRGTSSPGGVTTATIGMPISRSIRFDSWEFAQSAHQGGASMTAESPLNAVEPAEESTADAVNRASWQTPTLVREEIAEVRTTRRAGSPTRSKVLAAAALQGSRSPQPRPTNRAWTEDASAQDQTGLGGLASSLRRQASFCSPAPVRR